MGTHDAGTTWLTMRHCHWRWSIMRALKFHEKHRKRICDPKVFMFVVVCARVLVLAGSNATCKDEYARTRNSAVSIQIELIGFCISNFRCTQFIYVCSILSRDWCVHGCVARRVASPITRTENIVPNVRAHQRILSIHVWAAFPAALISSQHVLAPSATATAPPT